MSIVTLKAEFEAAASGKSRQEVLSRLYRELQHAPKAGLDEAVALLRPLLSVPSPNDAADVALLLGALVEGGADAAPLAEALVAPLERWLVAAARFAEVVAELDDAPEGLGPEEVLDLDGRRLARADVDQLHEEDPEAVASWFSQEVWFRPAVAAWTRAPAVLARARARRPLREALDALRDLPGGTHWLRVLFDACGGERLVLLVPELTQAYEVVADGVVDVGQLSVLLSSVLAAPLGQLGASGPASAAVLKCMLGQGPQQVDEVYPSRFYLYPWRALNPKTRAPEDGRFTWRAPGGVGTHSLPADFQPATVEPLDGARVLVLVGPKHPSLQHRFVRGLAASRAFDQLQARLSEPVALGAEGLERWLARVAAAQAAPSA